MDTFPPLKELANEADIRVGNAAGSLDVDEDVVVAAALFPHEVGDGEGHTSGDTLGAMDEDFAVCGGRFYEVEDVVEDADDVLGRFVCVWKCWERDVCVCVRERKRDGAN